MQKGATHECLVCIKSKIKFEIMREGILYLDGWGVTDIYVLPGGNWSFSHLVVLLLSLLYLLLAVVKFKFSFRIRCSAQSPSFISLLNSIFFYLHG